MTNSVFKSNRSNFEKINDSLIDMVTGHMSIDIERGLKMTAGMPVDKGQMKASTRSFRNERGKFRTEINKEYAAVQEAGIRQTGKGAPTQPFKNYTTAGTGSGFFRKAIDAVWRLRTNYIEEARRALGL